MKGKTYKSALSMNLLKFFSEGDNRTITTRKNMLGTAFFKACDALVYYLVVPLTLGYVNQYEYGIWLTLNSFLLWVDYFDIGLGNGLRNKLAIAIATNDHKKAREYVSTTLVMLVFLGFILFSVFSILVCALDWYSLLNIDATKVPDLREIIWISMVFFVLNFVLKFIGNVWQALQLPSVSSCIIFLGHLLSLLIILVLTRTVQPGSLLWIAIAYSAGPPAMYAIAYPFTFRKALGFLSPSLRCFRRDSLKDLLSLSLLFFLLQAASLILFTTSNLVISKMFGPEEVTPYNISYRFFSIVLLTVNTIMVPLWSAATDAWAKHELSWIRDTNRRVRKMMCFITVGVVLMVASSQWVYLIWVGEEVVIPLRLSVFMALYILIVSWSTCYSHLLNGIGVLRLQSIHTMFAAAVFLPLAFCLGRRFGTVGIVMTMCLAHLPGTILNIVQFHKILDGRAVGLWKK